ncbi:polysaccharide deacetylase family protein [Bacillus massiliigorillae]|uniref:polysaccharide deacetylase family protein n=1 Tax=Bacillus massiliigorillae TaxID=1243664 RepID=UPI0003A49548|nr:polysaccharide deacetylase family protein [Bacillus massiliigorillae]
MTKFVRTLVMVVFVGLVSFGITKETEAVQNNYVQAIRTTAVYDVVDGKELQIGTINAKQQFVLSRSDANRFYIKYGNNNAYFDKRNGQVGKKTTNFVQANVMAATNDVVVTKAKTPVYDRTVGSKQVLAVININIRYPVIGKVKDWYQVNVGNRIGYISAQAVTEDKGIPVLMYHHMLPNPELTPFSKNSMVIKVSTFQEQMKYLKANGWRTITLQELDRYLYNEQNLTGRVVAITFDDGNTSTVKYAYPILKANNQKATQFIIGDRVRAQAKPWDEMTFSYVGYKEMRESKDVYDFQSHTFGLHLRDPITSQPYLIKKNYDEILNDTLRGKEHIGAFDGNPNRIQYLAYPWGQFDQEAVSAISEAGIRMAFTTNTGNVKLGDDRYELNRQGIAPSHSMTDFINKLNGTYKGRNIVE